MQLTLIVCNNPACNRVCANTLGRAWLDLDGPSINGSTGGIASVSVCSHACANVYLSMDPDGRTAARGALMDRWRLHLSTDWHQAPGDFVCEPDQVPTAEQVRLFDLKTLAPIGQGVSFSVTATPQFFCIPTMLRFPIEVLEGFRIREVFVGDERMLLEAKSNGGKSGEGAHLFTGKRIAMEPVHEFEFSLHAQNISQTALPFNCEVWGEKPLPTAEDNSG